MKKFNFDFDVSALSNYTEEPAELIRKAVVGAKTMMHVTHQTGIKSAETINYIGGDITFQAGGTCGFNASGTRDISQRTITVCKIKVNEEMCMKTLESKFTQKLLSPGSTYDESDIPSIFIDDMSEKIAYEVEKLLWRGDTAGSGNLALCDGFNKLIDNSTGAVRSSSGTAFTGNEVAVIKQFVLDIPEEIRDQAGLTVFMGRDWFDQYNQAIFSLNNRWDAPEDGTDGKVLYTNIPIVVVPGLTGQSRIVCTYKENMIVGQDLENEEEQFDMWFSKDDDIHKLKVEFKLGVQFAFPELVVYYAE